MSARLRGVFRPRSPLASRWPKEDDPAHECWGPRADGEVSAGPPERRGYASSSKRYSSYDVRDHSTRPTTIGLPGRRGAPRARRLAADDVALAYAIKTAKPSATPAQRPRDQDTASDSATCFPVMKWLPKLHATAVEMAPAQEGDTK
jgi:hypothetical protein